jgi:LmbE family N-acetylglucosaminyl deacetylase
VWLARRPGKVASALPLTLAEKRAPSILCLGAHSDDIEIGCGGTVLRLAERPAPEVHWVVCSATGPRGPKPPERRKLGAVRRHRHEGILV